MSDYAIDPTACRGRQRRLQERMAAKGVDLAIVQQPENVLWLTGARFPWVFSTLAALTVDGQAILAAPPAPESFAEVDKRVPFEAQWHSTLRNDQIQAASEALASALDLRSVRTVGVEHSTVSHYLPLPETARSIDLEPDLYSLRRRKDPDELARIEKAISATEAMYARAREIIRPGVCELDVFNELQTTAVTVLGEPPWRSGNDFRCGCPGGPPRQGRLAEAGELYILDLGPDFRGYFADNCRTIAVTDVSDKQQEAWETVMRALAHVEQEVRPGKSAQLVFHEVQQIMDECPHGRFTHHLGHGIGLFPHEAPHLNPRWDDVFEEGDVFTAEPGIYSEQLRGGMRIENNYRVTAEGVRKLTNFSMEL